jgi:hypothetical protein
VKTYRWLTLVAALLITLSEVLVFNSEAGRGPQKQATLAGVASFYWAAAGVRSPQRVR